MIYSLLAFLKSKVTLYAIFSLIVGFFWLTAWSFKIEARALKNKISVCEQQIKIQNQEIVAFKLAADLAEKKEKELSNTINAYKKVSYQKLDEYKNSKIPDKCEEAIQYGIAHADYRQ